MTEVGGDAGRIVWVSHDQFGCHCTLCGTTDKLVVPLYTWVAPPSNWWCHCAPGGTTDKLVVPPRTCVAPPSNWWCHCALGGMQHIISMRSSALSTCLGLGLLYPSVSTSHTSLFQQLRVSTDQYKNPGSPSTPSQVQYLPLPSAIRSDGDAAQAPLVGVQGPNRLEGAGRAALKK